MSADDIGQESLNHRSRNHETDILSDIARITLKGDADHFAVLQYRTTGVTGIDRRVDLDREMGIGAGVTVAFEIDARDDPLSNGKAFTTDGITVDVYSTLNRR